MTDLFFSIKLDEVNQAKRICAGCLYRSPCYETAVAMKPSVWGVWGGQYFNEGQEHNEIVPVGRPPKGGHGDEIRLLDVMVVERNPQ